MKVVYVKSIEHRLRDAIQEAEGALRKIEKIELTINEANEVRRHFNEMALYSRYIPAPGLTPYSAADAGKSVGAMYGIPLQIEA